MVKKSTIILSLLLFLITNVTIAKDKIVFTDPLKNIVVKKSRPTFSIILQSNPTTGYSWFLKHYDSNFITPIAHRYYSGTTEKNKKVGAPGYEKWIFRAKPGAFIVPQLTSISIIYMRPGDEHGARIINFKVVSYDAN
jgi:predicted secreted protein